MADQFEDWERRADGSIAINPVTGWDSATAFGMACMLRVHYARSDAELIAGTFQKLPLVMTPVQARQLAQDLLRMAGLAEQKPGSAGS